jgi:protein subunit release factor A
MSDLLSKLATLFDRREEIGKQLADPAVIADQKRFIEFNRTYRIWSPSQKPSIASSVCTKTLLVRRTCCVRRRTRKCWTWRARNAMAHG